MITPNPAAEKSYAFALRIIKLRRFLRDEKSEYDISKQVLRSGTSIGANVEEAIGGHSRKDFKHKLTISYQEARETHYWLRLLRDSGFIEGDSAESLLHDCDELLKIIGSTLITLNKDNEGK
ncbi:four helix bundle protein [Coraliomargarita sp. W4R53]